MYNIIFISTIHKELGKCNASELCKIIESLHPEVVFLEALENTFSKYDQLLSSSGVEHKKLEIQALQKCIYGPFEYIPVLDVSMSNAFDKKYNTVCEDYELQKLIDNFQNVASELGFNFLNSKASVQLHEEMRKLESKILNYNEQDKNAKEFIDEYENSMFRNIYEYCRRHQFETAIFMCGNAHRKSMIEKFEKFNVQEDITLNWSIYGS